MSRTTRPGLSARAFPLAHAVGLLCWATLIACGGAPDSITRDTSASVAPPVVPPATPPATPPAVPPVEQPSNPPVGSPFIVDTGATPGGRLVFTYGDDPYEGPTALYTMLPDGAELTELTPPDAYNNAWSPVWSPDDALIAYATYAPFGVNVIWVVRPDGSGRRQVAQGDYPFWLADGRVGYTCNSTNLCAVDASGGNATVLLGRPAGATGFGFTLSPDGSMIAFVRQVENETHVYYGTIPFTIWVMRRDGTGERRLTSTDSSATYESSPSWSRDGSQIAFFSARYGIAVADADGGRLHGISHQDDIQPSIGTGSPAWSPDGTKIIFGGDHGRFFIANADGSGLIRRVTVPMALGYGAGSWSWSKR